MNAIELSELLNDLPDQMIVSAYSHSRTGKNPASAARVSAAVSAANSGGHIAVSHKNAAVPRWTIAAVLAACLLFAVGFGAILLHGKQNDLIPQQSQVDSMLDEVTAETTSALTATAKPVTVTTQRTEQANTTTPDSGTTQPVSASITSEASISIETEAAESTAAAAEIQTADLPGTSETAVSSTETETTTAASATTAPREPHKIMQMTSVEEVEREGDRMVGVYERRIAELKGEISEDAPRITAEEVVQMIGDGMDFRAVFQRLHELYPYPDYNGGSGVSNIEYWLDDSGTDFILLTIESESIVHIVHASDGTANVYDILNKRR